MDEVVSPNRTRGIKPSNVYKHQHKGDCVKQAASKFIAKIIDIEHAFNFHPCSYTSRGIIKAQLFEEEGREISLDLGRLVW